MSPKTRDFFNKFLPLKGTSSQGARWNYPQLKQFFIKQIHGVVAQMEHHTPLSIPTVDLSKETRVVADMRSTNFRLDWLDRPFIGEGSYNFSSKKWRS